MKLKRFLKMGSLACLAAACACAAPRRAVVEPPAFVEMSGKVFSTGRRGSPLEFEDKTGRRYLLRGPAVRRLAGLVWPSADALPVRLKGFPLEWGAGQAVFQVEDYSW